MADDEEQYGDMEGWVEPDDFFCQKCNRQVDMPKWDGPYEYYETTNLHGRICTECNRQLCDDCANWQRGESGHLICFECYDEERHSSVNLTFHKAIVFAAKKHDKQYRKSTDIPYIAHLMEVMQILQKDDCYEDVIIAGILHDTLEDTDTTEDEIRSTFGKNILSIVLSVSENKNLDWFERKSKSIIHIRESGSETKLVCCADKLSNLRSINADLRTIGEKVWDRFNAPKKEIEWYYKEIFKALIEINDTYMYNELSELIDAVFDLDWSSYGKE
jgi:HD superfamily phosphohydrolase YqeK